MPFAFVNDIPASWEIYERIAAELGEDPPEGLIVHAAGRTDEGFRIIDVWEDEAAFRAFYHARLGPVVARHVERGLTEPSVRELHVDHVLRSR